MVFVGLTIIELHRSPTHSCLQQEVQRAHREVLQQDSPGEVRMGDQVCRRRLGILSAVDMTRSSVRYIPKMDKPMRYLDKILRCKTSDCDCGAWSVSSTPAALRRLDMAKRVWSPEPIESIRGPLCRHVSPTGTYGQGSSRRRYYNPINVGDTVLEWQMIAWDPLT